MFDPRDFIFAKALPTPDWSQAIADSIADDYNIRRPRVLFFQSKDGNGGGWYNHRLNELVVITIFDFMSDMLTIVHEMSHAITDHDHTPEMYETMLSLVEQFGLDERLAIRQELEYMPEPFAEAFARRYIDERP